MEMVMIRKIGNKGFLHIGSILVIALAMVGAWFIYRSYSEGHIKQNLTAIYKDYRGLVRKVVKDPKEQDKADDARENNAEAALSKDALKNEWEKVKAEGIEKFRHAIRSEKQ